MQYNKLELVFASDDLNKSELLELVHDMTMNIRKVYDGKLVVTNWTVNQKEGDELE